METNQIIRIPIKYGELFSTMSDEESGKLIKSLFIGNNDGLTGLTLTYYNIIMVDINNLYNSASNGKRGGRPKKKPGVIENDNLGLGKSITNTSKDNIKEDKIKEVENFVQNWNKIFGKNYLLTDDLQKAYITCRKKYSLEEIQIGASTYYQDKVSKWGKEERKQYELHILKFLSQKNGLANYL